jgi:hypothetical protein
MIKQLSRKYKIQLLKDLYQRKISLSDLIPETIETWYFRNGIYTGLGLKLTEAEFAEYSSKRPKQKNLIYKLQEGNEPLKEDE